MSPPDLTAHPFENAIVEAWSPRCWKDTHIVLAVSGGADSVAMLVAMLRIKRRLGGDGKFCVGHLNHQLRRHAADDDAAWLTSLCYRLGVSIDVGNAEIDAHSTGDGWEATARAVRYEFLRQVAERFGARYVAVAHTADDQVETVLHRIIRGTGLSGLAGIPFSRTLSPSVSLVRPLLKVRRHEVLQYLAQIGQDFRRDSSNNDMRFTRNQLRHKLLPMLRSEYNSEIELALQRLATQAADNQVLIDTFADSLLESRWKVLPELNPNQPISQCAIDCSDLAQVPRALIRELLRRVWARAQWPQQAMGYIKWDGLAELALSEGQYCSASYPGGVQAERHGDSLILRRNQSLHEKDASNTGGCSY